MTKLTRTMLYIVLVVGNTAFSDLLQFYLFHFFYLWLLEGVRLEQSHAGMAIIFHRVLFAPASFLVAGLLSYVLAAKQKKQITIILAMLGPILISNLFILPQLYQKLHRLEAFVRISLAHCIIPSLLFMVIQIVAYKLLFWKSGNSKQEILVPCPPEKPRPGE